MPLIIKPRTLGLMTKVERNPPGANLIVSAYGLFNLATPDRYRFEGEQSLWLIAAKELPPGSVFDIGMPKPVAELLVGGYAAAPAGEPASRFALSWSVAGLSKSLLISGDRVWRLAGGNAVATEPAPFQQMPLAPARCFGGEGFAPNPAGMGFRARERLMAREGVALPNIEVPEQAIRSLTDTPEPARFGPMAVDAKERLRHAGTYDTAWLKTRAPALAVDADPRLFLFAPEDQRWARYLAGGERYRLGHFSAEAPEIEASLPDFRVRCFVGWVDREKPVSEVTLRIDTLWLFAGAGRGVLIYRGAVPVEDIEAADVADIMLAYEGRDENRPVSHHLAMRALREDPAGAFRYALADHQLSPARPPELAGARDAARQARSQARQAKQAANIAWARNKMLEQSGLPRELWPPPAEPQPPAFNIPFPLPEEIESGEIDLAAILDAMEAAQRTIESDLNKLLAAHEPMCAATATIANGDATSENLDSLFDALGQSDLPAELDSIVAEIPDAASLPPEIREHGGDLSNLATLKDWRGSLLASQPVVDEAGQLAKARARFLGLPEGGPLAAMRLDADTHTFELPELGDLPDLDEPVPEPPDAEASLAQAFGLLESHAELPPEIAASLKGALPELDGALRKSFPHLRDTPGGPIALLSALEPPMPPTEKAQTPKDALAAASSTLAALPAQMNARIDEAEAAMAKPFADMRRSSPTPAALDEPLAPSVAKAFAELILAEARAGLSLAGRDLAGADLAGADLAGVDLSKALLEGVRLDGARLTGANLAGATLCGASLVGADLSECDLSGTNLAKVDARRARFNGARLVDANLMNAAFQEASFDGADMRELVAMNVPFDGATFRRARIENCTFMRCALAHTDWTGATVERVQVMDADCSGIGLSGAQMRDVAFTKVFAAGADLRDAALTGVAFVGETNLAGARFDRVSAERLSFQKANLRDAVFERGRLDGACFVESDLTRVNFRLASLKRALLSRNDLGGANLTAAHLLEAQLNRADLRGAVLWSANLHGADLADARLTGADLGRANLTGTLLAVSSDA